MPKIVGTSLFLHNSQSLLLNLTILGLGLGFICCQISFSSIKTSVPRACVPQGGGVPPRFPRSWDGGRMGKCFHTFPFWGNVGKHRGRHFPSVGDAFPQKRGFWASPKKKGASRCPPTKGE
jgi:hypothetical protein